MSDNMERDKAELLTAKEREEEEEMKRELLDMKMYETWYTYKDMKQILGFINESKDMANMAEEKNAQKELSHSSNDCPSEIMPKANLAQELEIQEQSDASKSMHSLRSNHASPIFDRITTHSHSSPEPVPGTADSRNSAHRSKNLDSDDMFDRLHDNLNIRDSYSQNTNRYISLKSKNTIQDSLSTHNTEAKMDAYSERDQKLERWRINPLDSCVSENDVPLRQPERPVVQDSMPFRLCAVLDAQTPEELLLAVYIHLKETAELWHSWHRTTDTKFQWGSPIQVGPAKGSLDKESLTNIMNEENQMEYTNKYKNERLNKRKSTLVPFSSNTRHSSSDEDEKTVKKSKIQSYEGSDRILRSHKEAIMDKNERNQYSDNENIDRDFENMETENLEMEHEKRECCSPDVIPLQARKIAPPNPRKSINKKRKHSGNTSAKGSSVHNSNEEESAVSLLPKGKSSILTDQEILIELEKDETNDNIKTNSENIEIKPLPMKGLSHRIKNECIILERIHKEKQKKMEIEKEEVQKKENEEKRKREEFYRKQMEERQQREKEKEQKEKSRKEKSKKWNNIVGSREKLRGLREQNENKISEIVEENRLYQDNSSSVTKRMETAKTDSTNNVNCPICNQSFPSDKIEAHAAGCEQFMTDSEDENNANLLRNKITLTNVNNDGVLECGICSMYKTTNSVHYKEHIDNCLQQKQCQTESCDEYATSETDNILSSPVRCFRPISEQTDSDIDYRGQFPSNSRTQIHSRKRRRH